MGLFSPWFLLAGLGVALPVWIHLLRQHKSEPRQFASLMFFEPRTQSSVKHRRLKHYLLLALRAAMVLLLALLFANPFVRRMRATGTGSRLTLVAIDNSFSMRYGDHLERARQQALETIRRAPREAPLQVAAVNDRVELASEITNDAGAAAAAVRGILAADTASAFAEFARFLRGLPKTAKMPVEAHLFSDVQQSAMPPSFADLIAGDDVRLVIHPVTDAAANWAVETVSAPARVTGNRTATIQATVAYHGPADAKPAARSVAATLRVNGKDVANTTVAVTARGQAEFRNIELPHGLNRCEVRVDASDALPQDNMFLFSIERADAGHVLYVGGTRDTPYYRAALETGAGTAFDFESASPAQAAAFNLAKYAYVVLTVPAGPLEPKLMQYVSNGGGLFVAMNPTLAAAGRVPVAGLTVSGARSGGAYQTAGSVDRSHPAFADTAGFDGVKFYWSANVDTGDSRILARLSDGSPLVAERRVGEGRVMVFASGFDNVTNDLPLHAAFVPLVEKLSGYLEGGEILQSAAVAGGAIELRAGKNRGAAADVTSPSGQRMLSLKEAATSLSLTARETGFYSVRTAGGRQELVAVNADRRESDLTPAPAESLALWSGTAGSTQNTQRGETPEPVEQPLWRWLLLAVAMVALVESWIANRFVPALDEGAHRRKQAA